MKAIQHIGLSEIEKEKYGIEHFIKAYTTLRL